LELADLFPERLSQDQLRKYRRDALEAERQFELLVIEIAKEEAKSGDLSDESISRLALAHERIHHLHHQLTELGCAPAVERPALLEVALGDVMTASSELVRYAVNPWIPRRHVTLLGGHGGIGKSSLGVEKLR
jgi:hypothetical protein